MPTYTDFEGHIVTQTIGTIPVSFIVWNTVTEAFDISPSSQLDVGDHSISLNLRDGSASSSYTLIVRVANNAPAWGGSMTAMTVPVLSTQTQNLPSTSDPDAGAVLSVSYS